MIFEFDPNSKELINPIIKKHNDRLIMNVAVLAQEKYEGDFNALYLHRLIVNERFRGGCFGTSFMKEFTKWCDDYEIILGTTPRTIQKDPELQAYDQERLVNFLKSFGFKHASDPTVNKYWNVLTGDYFRLPI